ncbi:hypothetical protein Tco_0692330 [Tanacetum coccineum]
MLVFLLPYVSHVLLREQVGRCGRGRGPRGGNDERVDELNGQGNDQGLGANGNVEGVNGGVGGAPDFLTIIAQQLQNLLPSILTQVMDIQENDKNRSQNNKTEHENEKSVKEKSNQSQKSTKSQSQIKSKSTSGSGFGKSIENQT